jgi:AI-2E family transporter
MATPSSPASSYRPLILLGGIVLVTTSLYFAQKILIPLALAVLLAFVLIPLVELLQRRGFWRIPSVLLVVLLALLLVGGVGLGLAPQIKALAGDLPQYKDNIAHKIAGLRDVGQGTVLQDLQDMFKEITEGTPKGGRAPEGSAPEPPVVAWNRHTSLCTSRLPDRRSNSWRARAWWWFSLPSCSSGGKTCATGWCGSFPTGV